MMGGSRSRDETAFVIVFEAVGLSCQLPKASGSGDLEPAVSLPRSCRG